MMNKARVYWAALALTAAATAAHADISLTPTVVNDYDFRGFSQNAKDPALQLGVDYSDKGIHFGFWTSEVNFGSRSTEIDWTADYSFGSDKAINWNVGVVNYTYAGGGSYPEFWVLGSKGWFSAAAHYSYDYGNTSQDAFYGEANASIPVGSSGFNVTAHVGYSDGQYWTNYAYTDYSVGVSKTFGNFPVALKYVSSNYDDDPSTPGTQRIKTDVNNTEGRVILSISTTLPWGK